ncbi:MAG TPA: hemerythrin domain-containing protein [Ramlibacter sp.]|nr:hemerythrin domain-containing protein [Ramlibacter sp.]
MPQEATALLDQDHQRVEQLFTQFQSAQPQQKEQLAHTICQELTVHAMIEEEIFYPAFLKATSDQDMVDEAAEEHQEVKELIAKLESGGSPDELVPQLQEAVMHHVQEERDEMFKKARAAKGLDLQALGQQLEQRKLQLMRDLQAA